MPIARKRVSLIVQFDLDPIPGANHTAEDAALWLQHSLDRDMPHYRPAVGIHIPDVSPSPMIQLELLLHDADCPGHDANFQGHGDKYTKLAEAAAKVFPPDREPFWLKDRKLVQEASLGMIFQRLDAIVTLLGGNDV